MLAVDGPALARPVDEVRDVCLKPEESLVWGDDSLPLELDIGCHRGLFVVEMAQRYPGFRFLGVERLRNRVDRCGAKIQRLQLSNARVVQAEGLNLSSDVVENGSVSRIHVSFPDPWPKRRHYVRRLVNEQFLLRAAELLVADGELRLMTDHPHYFQMMSEAAARLPGVFCGVSWDDGREYPVTEFQRKFAQQGLIPFTLALRRCA